MAVYKFAFRLGCLMSVGSRIQERLETTGLSQSELARRVHLTQPAINALIRGSSRSSTHLHRIARELGTTPAYLTGETDDPDADAPPAPELSPDEARLITDFRELDPADRSALLRVAERMRGARTLHDTRPSYRPGEADG
jgi:transcriptional regulator with XRE-family HTH domain